MTSVHSKQVFACNDCTFLDEIHRAALEKKTKHNGVGSEMIQSVPPGYYTTTTQFLPGVAGGDGQRDYH